MSTAIVELPPSSSLPEHLPIVEAGAREAMDQFFDAEIDNPRTRRAYVSASADFFRFALPMMGAGLGSLTALHFSCWIEDMKVRGLSTPTIKQRLAGVRMLFQSLARQQIIKWNPVAVVKGPRYSVQTGKTPMLDGDETNRMLQAIDTSTLIGLRDRAMIGTMAYSFARVSAVTSLDVVHVFHQRQRLWLRLAEKGGQCKDVPCHHHLETYLTEWIEAADLGHQQEAPLFQTFTWEEPPPDAARGDWPTPDTAPFKHKPRRRIASGERMTQAMTWEMVQRRAERAGIKTAVCNHTFRAAGITAYLKNGGTIERAAAIAGHASTRTTKLYDRRNDELTLDEIEKIRFT